MALLHPQAEEHLQIQRLLIKVNVILQRIKAGGRKEFNLSGFSNEFSSKWLQVYFLIGCSFLPWISQLPQGIAFLLI